VVARLNPLWARRIGAAAALAVLAWWAPRAALLAALALSIWWVMRRDDDAGTWGVFYVVFLIILGILTMLVAGLALVHHLLGG
jgi:hypothetical protein